MRSCRRRGSLEAALPAGSTVVIQVLFDPGRNIRLSLSGLWKPFHNFKKLAGSGAGLRFRQWRAKLRHNFVAHGDVHGRSRILTYLPDQLRQPFPRLADGKLHALQCTMVYKMSQQQWDLGCHGTVLSLLKRSEKVKLRQPGEGNPARGTETKGQRRGTENLPIVT